MIKIRFISQILFFSLLIWSLSCQNNDKPSPGDETTNLRGSFIPEADLAELIIDLNTDMEETYNRGDMKGLVAFYSDETLMLGPGGYKIEGIESVNDYWSRITNPVSWSLRVNAISRKLADLYETDNYKKMPNKPTDWKDMIGDKYKGRDVVYELGHSTLKYKKESGEVQTSDVDFILVWVQQPDGSYKIAVDSYAVN